MTETFRLADIAAEPPHSQNFVRMYYDRLMAGEKLLPILISRNSIGVLKLVDGAHRYEAHRQAGRRSIEANVMSIH